jgi:hypothetical protein
MKIYLRLDEEITEQFHKIKKYSRLKNDSEVLRYLIADFWRKNKKKIQAETEVNGDVQVQSS